MWQFSTQLMIYVAWLIVVGAALGNVVGAVVSTAFSVMLLVVGFAMLFLVLAFYTIGRLLGDNED